ncbi:MAG: DNA primase [Bacteroidales bacterium]|nr:DNA primase [Bacteroidales bacterium]
MVKRPHEGRFLLHHPERVPDICINLAYSFHLMIKPETIQRIIDTARIEEVIGDFVSLKKRGSNYVGLCPFHNEKTPSFSVSPAKGIYKCFGCGKAGNSVNFVIEHEHYSYPEALKYIAKKYNIEVEEEEVTPEMQLEIDERESMFAVNGFMSTYFQHNLTETEEGKSVALSYLKERDYRDSTIQKFELGYAIDQWHNYTDHAIDNGYKKEVLTKVGLSIDKDSRLIDRFRGRVIFPIHNLTGKVIGFGGRILSSEKSTAKYINSPESDIYNKSRVLYGIYFARTEIVKQNNCYLVEGYTDVISMHQAGIENVVASSGTSLTEEQIRLIKRFTPNITILFDGDTAGIKASFRGIDLILEQGMNVKIVLFPDGEDPDSFVRKHRSSEIEEFITKQAKDFIAFKTNLLLDETVGDPTKRADLIKEIIQTISHIPDGINRSVYIKECSTIMDVPEQTLMNELNKRLRQHFKKQPENADIEITDIETRQSLDEQIKIDPLDISENEKQLIRLLLLYADEMITVFDDEEDKEIQMRVDDFILKELHDEQISFTKEIFNEIIKEFGEAREKDNELAETHFTNHPKAKIAAETINLLTSPHQLSENWKKNKIFVKQEEDQLSFLVLTTWLSLKAKYADKHLKEILELMKTSPAEEIDMLINQYNTFKKISIQIHSELTRVISY